VSRVIEESIRELTEAAVALQNTQPLPPESPAGLPEWTGFRAAEAEWELLYGDRLTDLWGRIDALRSILDGCD
jgi:hypothetical protein